MLVCWPCKGPYWFFIRPSKIKMLAVASETTKLSLMRSDATKFLIMFLQHTRANHKKIFLQRVTERTNTVKLTDRMWGRLLASTNQPSFVTLDDLIQARVDRETAEDINNIDIASI